MCAAALLAGCEREGVRTRDVAKGVERVPAAPEPAPGPDQSAEPVAADRAWPWTVPQGWTEDPTPRQMRLATYLAPDPAGPVEVAVTRFAGRVGGELANINRWRGQMGLAPLGEGELEAAVVRFASLGHDGYRARIESAAGVMLAAAVYQEAIDQTWFVRSTVPDAGVADRLERDIFAMARSIAGLAQ
ncbi:MAG: hypothetical protein C0513_06900 [Isosphaera sp.]|nr:hypothetical protein [Isosphaera sp.]